MGYEEHMIKEYEHWIANIHPDQGCLGKFLLWSKETEGSNILRVSPEAWSEIYVASGEIGGAIEKLWQPETVSMKNLGYRTTKMVHPHFIPRYDKDIEFAGEVFSDRLDSWMEGFPSKIVSDRVLYSIRDAIVDRM